MSEEFGRIYVVDEARLCGVCARPIPERRLRKNALFCRHACERAAARVRHRAFNLQLDLSTGTVGAIAELFVAADMLRRGYNVFRAVSPSSPVDIVAVSRLGVSLRVEVKTGSKAVDGRLIFGRGDNSKYDVLAVYIPSDGAVAYHPEVDPYVAVRTN